MDLKGMAATTASKSRFLDVYSFLRNKLLEPQAGILIYHRVSPAKNDWYPPPINPTLFEREIEYFCRTYEIITLDNLARCLQNRKSLPEKAIVITFDDGNKDNYLCAYPILKKYHAPATIFLSTGSIGTNNPFWWNKVDYTIRNAPLVELTLNEIGTYSLKSIENRSKSAFSIIEKLSELDEKQKNLIIDNLISISGINIPANLSKERILSWNDVQEMSSENISFGAHSVTHPILTRIPLEQARWEIIQSKKDIEEKTGRAVTAFAYPNGIYNNEVINIVKENAFNCAVIVNPGKLINSKTDPYQLNRIGAVGDLDRLKVLLSGLYYDLKAISLKREEHD